MEEFIKQLALVLQLDPEEIGPDTVLGELESWDSLAMVSFIAMADTDYGKDLEGEAVIECETVAALYRLVK